MLDFIKRLFGEGNIYAGIMLEDGTTGRIKTPYVGSIDTLDHEEFVRYVKNEVWFKHGKKVISVTDIRCEGR